MKESFKDQVPESSTAQLEKVEENSAGFEAAVIDAERISFLQIEIQHRIIEGNLHEDEWMGVLDDLIAHEPKLEKYREMLAGYISLNIEIKKKIDQMWDVANLNQDGNEKKEGSDTEGDSISRTAKRSNLNTAGPDVALELARKIGVSEEEIVFTRVVKGRRSLCFFMEEESFRKMNHTGFGFATSQYIVPAVFIKEAGTGSSSVMQHEIQHIQNKLLTRFTMQIYLRTSTPKDVRNFLEKNTQDLVEGQIFDEILAQASIFSGVNVNEVVHEKVDEYFKAIEAEMKEYYLPKYLSYLPRIRSNKINNAQEEPSNYEKTIDTALIAIKDLLYNYWPIYKENSGAMVINTLQQFSINRWPAIVRLIKSRRV
jgi:hypothetical protein